MKKQILIFAMFTLALIFAGTNSFSQTNDIDYLNVGTTECPVPAVLNCGTTGTTGHLNPIPGVVYDYEVSVAPGVTTGYVQWFVTDESTLINATGVVAGIMEPNDGTSPYLLAATPAANYNSTTNTNATISASWQSFDGSAHNVLLVAYVKGENGCSDNIEVWRIEPAFTFRLEIAGLLPDGTIPASGNASECVTPVQSAVYDGVAGELVMDYGDNYVFFVVSAASFVDSWQPTFTVATTSSTPVALTDVTWAYPADALATAGPWRPTSDPVEAQDPLNAVGDDGECIIVRVHLDHGNIENDVATTVTLGVDGIMYDIANNNYTNPTLADLDNAANPGDPCVIGSNDTAVYDLTPRPNITEVAPVPGTFEPKN
jgi:hypothetical protein